jgi:hypothetical protein
VIVELSEELVEAFVTGAGLILLPVATKEELADGFMTEICPLYAKLGFNKGDMQTINLKINFISTTNHKTISQ